MFSDRSDQIVRKLDQIIAALGGDPNADQSVTNNNKVTKNKNVTNNYNTTVNRNVEVHEPTDQNTPTYFSTGPKAVTAKGGEWTRLGFGFLAKTVNIRSDIALYISFANPDSEGNIIPVNAGDLPFTIGGPEAIDTAFLWVKPQDKTKNASVNVIAYQ